MIDTTTTAQDLIDRSNRLGTDPRNTNYAGGNTSAKGTETDPVTGQPVELLWVKGSGGDLGTLTEKNLAVLRLDRLRSLVDVYPGLDREDEMVAAFDYCLHGKGGATPSIDTAMHGLVDAAHVDHLHPDSGIALATAVDGEELTRKAFGDRVVWVPWRRPGFQLGLDIAAIKNANPQAIGCILGGHGITAWGDTSQEAEQNSLEIIRTAEEFLRDNGSAAPFGPVVPGYEALPEVERRAKAAALAPTIRGIASADRPQVGHYTDSDVVLEFLAREKLAPLAELGTSCPDHFLRTKVKPLVVDLPRHGVEDIKARLVELHAAYRADYQGYYDRNATPDSPVIRGADPAIVLVPGVGMFSFGKDKQTARVAGEFYVNAINVMRGAESVSTYQPISEAEKFAIEYWALEEAKLQRMPKPKALATRVAVVTGAGSGIGKAIATRIAAEGGCVVIADLNLGNAQQVADELGGSDVAVAVKADVSDEQGVADMFAAAALAFGGADLVVNNAGLSLSKPLLETTVKDWDLQHNVMAKGSFLVSREAARVMIEQQLGGDIIYISSKNSVFAGPNNIAYSATKADQAHQVRLLAAELGQYGVRVNGINPDGVVRGSGIFAAGWGASRAAVYGVKEEDLGAYYAKRTLLGKEVLPEHIGDAVYALAAGDLSQTTGLHIPVDSGVAAGAPPMTRVVGGTGREEVSLAAVDLGASSGRVIHGRVGPGVLQMQEVRRFRNGPVTLPDGLYWDILGLYQDILEGLRDAARIDSALRGIAIDTWAVDYGLVDAGGALLGNPHHYRDGRTGPVIDNVHAAAPADKLYSINGLQYLSFNTLYQFAADPRIHEPGVQALLIPDLLGYWLTGERVAEDTNASTTGLLDARTGLWSTDLIDTLGLPTGLLPPVVPPGTVVGELTPQVRTQIGLDRPLALTTVGSHDTASAIVGVPAANPNFAYISCGTWGLVGVELDGPVLTEQSRAANFTNERGVDGTTRFLRNVMGLWVLSETVRTWELNGPKLSLTGLIAMAAEVSAGGPTFDPDEPQFLPPGDMAQRIVDACVATGQQPPATRPEIVRCILDSLAVTFAARVADAQRLSGRRIEVIHIVGGGSRNQLLCQLVADAAGLPVVAGPVEATALGNLLVQARTHGALSGDLWALRAQLRAAVTTSVYEPRPVHFGRS